MAELESIRASSQARSELLKRQRERKRNTLVLILRYLADEGYSSSVQAVSQETNLSLQIWDAADNITLDGIIHVRLDSSAACCCKI